jgi:hypothetical protein
MRGEHVRPDTPDVPRTVPFTCLAVLAIPSAQDIFFTFGAHSMLAPALACEVQASDEPQS